MIEHSKPGRGKGLVARVGAWVFLALAPEALARAQETVEPALAPPPSWKLSLGLQGGWDSNVLFIGGDGSGDALTRLDVKLDRAWGGRRGRLALSGEGRGSLYRRASELDHVDHALAADAFYLLTRRASVRLSGAARSEYASEMAALTDAGLLLPPVLSRARSAQGVFSYLLARRTMASFDLQGDSVSFDSPDFIGGSMLKAGLSLARDVGRADRLSLIARYQRSAARDENSGAQSALAMWSRTLGAAARARVYGGATRFQTFGSPAYRVTPVGGGTLDARWGRHAFEVRLDRAVDLAYGVGLVRVNRLAAAHYALSMTRRLTLDVGATRARGRDAADSTVELRSDELAGGVLFTVAPDFAITGTYTYLRSDQGPSFSRSTHRAMLQVSYTRAWR